MSKWMKLTVVLALALILFLVGKEKGWFKMKPAGNKVSDDPTDPTGTNTTPPPTNTGTGTTTPPRTTGGTTINPGTGTTPKPKTIPGFKPRDEANKLYNLLNKLYDWNDEDEEAFDILISYTAEKLIAVNAGWREVFPTGRNLYDYINSEVVGKSRVTVLEKKIKILKTMRNLDLDKTP